MTLHIFKAPLVTSGRFVLGGNSRSSERAESNEARGIDIRKHASVNPASDTDGDLARESVRQELAAEFEAKLMEAREAATSDGYQAGFSSGHAEGVACGQEALRKQAEKLELLLDKVESAWAEQQLALQQRLQELTMDAVCKVLGEHVVDAKAVAGVVRQVIQKLRDADVVRIRLNPTECNVLRAALRKGEIDGLMPRLIEKLSEDATLVSGGCVVETLRGDYRATFDVQMQRLRDQIAQQRDTLTLPADTVRDVRRA